MVAGAVVAGAVVAGAADETGAAVAAVVLTGAVVSTGAVVVRRPNQLVYAPVTSSTIITIAKTPQPQATGSPIGRA